MMCSNVWVLDLKGPDYTMGQKVNFIAFDEKSEIALVRKTPSRQSQGGHCLLLTI